MFTYFSQKAFSVMLMKPRIAHATVFVAWSIGCVSMKVAPAPLASATPLRSTSMVDYGKSSTTGTKVSTSSSFKDGVEASASVGFDIGIIDLGTSADFIASTITTDSSSLEIRKSINCDIKVPGPSVDGIDHNHDIFYLWLNPLLNVTMDTQNNIYWRVAVDGSDMDIQYVYAGWLKDPTLMERGFYANLIRHGLTASDFATILAMDPFITPGSAIHPIAFSPQGRHSRKSGRIAQMN